MDKDIIIEMLEEIKEKLNNSKAPQFDTSTINNLTVSLQETAAKTNEYVEQFREILEQAKHPAKTNEYVEQFRGILEQAKQPDNEYVVQLGEILEQVKHPAKTEHRHIIDIQSSWVFFSLIGLSVMLLICGAIIYNQRQTLAQYRDNDLKYRRVLMMGGATTEGVTELQNIFEYNRNPQEIERLRKNVEEYERLVKERAERETQAELNAKAADKLNNEAETVKGRK